VAVPVHVCTVAVPVNVCTVTVPVPVHVTPQDQF
jgi:hypothetical protein